MPSDEQIRQDLVARFDFLAETAKVNRPRRITVPVPYARFREVLDVVVKDLGFTRLCTITGVDAGESFEVIYHLAHPAGTVLNLKTAVPKATPVLQTVSDTFPGCVLYERELVDLLGVEVVGLPPGKRYPLPDGWPAGQHPLRKDWKPEVLDAPAGAPSQEADHHG